MKYLVDHYQTKPDLFIDNDLSKRNLYVNGVVVDHPQYINLNQYKILVASTYKIEIVD